MGLSTEELSLLTDLLMSLKGSAEFSACSNECPSLKSIIYLMERSGLDAMEASMLVRLLKKFEETKK